MSILTNFDEAPLGYADKRPFDVLFKRVYQTAIGLAFTSAAVGVGAFYADDIKDYCAEKKSETIEFVESCNSKANDYVRWASGAPR